MGGGVLEISWSCDTQVLGVPLINYFLSSWTYWPLLFFLWLLQPLEVLHIPLLHGTGSQPCRTFYSFYGVQGGWWLEWRVEYHRGEMREGTEMGSCGASNATLRLLVYGWRERGSQRLESEMWHISKGCCLGNELKGTWGAGAGAEAGRLLWRLSPCFR